MINHQTLMKTTLHNVIILSFVFSTSALLAKTVQTGKASYYADKFDGRTTASGAIFRQNKLTAAHRRLPFGSKVRVTNLDNNKTVEVVINDRGPFSNGRIIDLSKRAARKLDFLRKGVVRVKVEILETSKRNKTKKNSQKTKKKQSVNKFNNVNYYEVATKSVIPTGFGIQVASYKEADNLIKHCDEIKKETNKDVLVKTSEANGEKVYIVILGSFSTQKQAKNFNQKLKNKFAGSFVFAF